LIGDTCQMCGITIEQGKAHFPESMNGLPFCRKCAMKIATKEREAERGDCCIIAPNEDTVKFLKSQPFKILPRHPRGGYPPKGFIFWKPKRTIYLDLMRTEDSL